MMGSFSSSFPVGDPEGVPSSATISGPGVGVTFLFFTNDIEDISFFSD
jgi:hypothetical protein